LSPFIFNAATCTCPCPLGFGGPQCATYDCATNPAPDVPACAVIPCDLTTNGVCPLKCICQGNTGLGIQTVQVQAPAQSANAKTSQPITARTG